MDWKVFVAGAIGERPMMPRFEAGATEAQLAEVEVSIKSSRRRRLMDDMQQGFDKPQEDELALVAMVWTNLRDTPAFGVE